MGHPSLPSRAWVSSARTAVTEGRLEPTETQAQVRPDLLLQPAVGRGRVLHEGSEGPCNHQASLTLAATDPSSAGFSCAKRSLPTGVALRIN